MPISTPLDPRIQRALDLIHRDFSRSLAVSDIARHVQLSESHFHHLFRRTIGVSPGKYLDSLKIRAAEQLLEKTSLPVKDIVKLVGVNDRSHFYRKFKRVNGLPPISFRKRKSE